MGYAELLAWTLAAIGAAVAGGTGAALRQHRRSGRFPGQPPALSAAEEARAVRNATFRTISGVVVLGAGLVAVVLLRG